MEMQVPNCHHRLLSRAMSLVVSAEEPCRRGVEEEEEVEAPLGPAVEHRHGVLGVAEADRRWDLGGVHARRVRAQDGQVGVHGCLVGRRIRGRAACEDGGGGCQGAWRLLLGERQGLAM